MKGLIILPYTKISKKVILELNKKFDYIIGVDGGCELIYKYGIKPDLIIGDFDSLKENILEYYKAEKVEIIKLEIDKDVTDGEAAIIEGFTRGCDELLICAPNSSIETDHQIGNIFLLNKYNNCTLINENELMKFHDGGKAVLLKKNGVNVSIVPILLSEMKLKGFKYSGIIKSDLGDTISLRNEITDEIAEINLLKGKILIIQRFQQFSMI